MNYSDPRAPHGAALRDYYGGLTDAKLTLHSSLGEHEEIPVSVFFRGPEDYFPFERVALARCHGRVLDVGAGTGVHSLYLQARGLEVCAIDVLPEAIEIMKARGVRDVRLVDVREFEGVRFDTILMMMNGIGILETLRGLDRFMRDVPRLLNPGGQILLDSGPANVVGDPGDAAEVVDYESEGYWGEAWIKLEYRGEEAPPFRELYVDAQTMTQRAEAAGWRCEVLHRDEFGAYVARLTRRAPAG